MVIRVGRHDPYDIDGTPATVEGAQTPVMSLYGELTAQLGGPSGTAVAVPGISCHDLAAQRTSHFVSAAREKGAKGALSMLSNDKDLATEFQATLDQSAAPWWAPDLLWTNAGQRTASIFGHHAPRQHRCIPSTGRLAIVGPGVRRRAINCTNPVTGVSFPSMPRRGPVERAASEHRLRPEPLYDRAPILCGAGAQAWHLLGSRGAGELPLA